ncbi:sporulation protein [Streptomyces sp. TRM66268-LWL]|uniref:Sporulation protein n=1 Tax=Streptomyces polyasparticus TaxID=2767826 RepID=A0ABR7SG24_9ACTN|nr:sporulation protein [Streptomyces polyasparticus]MBC9714436.1 sporulation protein [Streptomyces polyasparticus]
MAFRKLLSSLGINAPEVQTVLDNHIARPGEQLTATVAVRGGGADVEVERFTVELIVRFEAKDGQEEKYLNTVAQHTFEAPFTLRAGETRTEKVAFDLPLEMPLTHALGRPVPGAYSALRTELAIDKSVDKGDLDPVEIHALPAQDAVLRAMEELGFTLTEAEVKPGRARTTVQAVDWWQEIELKFPSEYERGTLELALIARESELDFNAGGAERLTLPAALTDDPAALKARIDAHLRERFSAGAKLG